MMTNPTAKYNYNLEGLRGIAALLVVLGHCFGIEYFLDPAFDTRVLGFLSVGHSAVLIFFILSGYVIGLTNKKSFDLANVKDYLSRRLVRLYPIYFIGVAAGVLVYNEPLWKVLGNFLFLQEILVPRIVGNSPVWSLNYEVVYYLFFLFFWAFGKNRLLVYGAFVLCGILAIAGGLFSAIPAVVSSYATGFIFWLSGLLLAGNPATKAVTNQKMPLISYLFLFLALANLKLGKVVLSMMGIEENLSGMVHISDLISVFPVCILIVAGVAGRKVRYAGLLKSYCFILPLLLFLYLAWQGRLTESFWYTKLILYVLAVISYPVSFSITWLSKAAPLGKISYALYLVHFPMMYALHELWYFSGTAITFTARILTMLVVSVLLSYFLEGKLQPWIKKSVFQQAKVRPPILKRAG